MKLSQKLRGLSNPRKPDPTDQVKIPKSKLNAGKITGKIAYYIPELKLACFCNKETDFAKLREKYLNRNLEKLKGR